MPHFRLHLEPPRLKCCQTTALLAWAAIQIKIDSFLFCTGFKTRSGLGKCRRNAAQSLRIGDPSSKWIRFQKHACHLQHISGAGVTRIQDSCCAQIRFRIAVTAEGKGCFTRACRGHGVPMITVPDCLKPHKRVLVVMDVHEQLCDTDAGTSVFGVCCGNGDELSLCMWICSGLDEKIDQLKLCAAARGIGIVRPNSVDGVMVIVECVFD